MSSSDPSTSSSTTATIKVTTATMTNRRLSSPHDQPSSRLFTTMTASTTDRDMTEVTKFVKGRRNSFSSFLTRKYRKTKSQQLDHERVIVRSDSNDRKGWTNGRYSNDNGDTQQLSPKEFQKGHRPRSFSEVAAVASPVERAPPVAITNKTPIYEYYGFVMYLASFVVFGLYVIWAYVPDDILHDMGITYYPDRYWALAIPVWLMVLVWFIFISFMTVNLMNTPPFDSYDCLTDEHANIMEMETILSENKPLDWMPELHDIPISVVNAYLYQDVEEDDTKDSSESSSALSSASSASSASPIRSFAKKGVKLE